MSRSDSSRPAAQRHPNAPTVSWNVRPGATGVVVAVGLVAFAVVGPPVADPGIAGFVWAAALGLFVIGVVWPCVVVCSLHVATTTSGDDPHRAALQTLRVGERTDVTVRVGARLGEVRLRWVGAAAGDWCFAGSGRACELDVPMAVRRRGRFERLLLTVSSDVPFGALTVSRVVALDAARPLLVGPPLRPQPHVEVPDAPISGASITAAVGHGGDTTRTVRPYVTGDPAHLVHWPSTARTGTVVVRELEPPAGRSMALVVDLGPADATSSRSGAGVRGTVMPTVAPSDAERTGEEAVAAAAAAATAFASHGVRVVVCTSNAGPSGPVPVSDEVGDEEAVLRRLAGAVAGPTARPPVGWPVVRFGVGDDHV